MSAFREVVVCHQSVKTLGGEISLKCLSFPLNIICSTCTTKKKKPKKFQCVACYTAKHRNLDTPNNDL